MRAAAETITADRVAVIPRFMRHVEMGRYGPHPSNGRCWLWLGGTTEDGYGVFSFLGRSVRAHRWSYETFVGPVPDGLVLDHFVCDTPGCVSPLHVRPATVRENNLRGDSVSARALAATHCPQGHEYSDANTYIWRGIRNCRRCRADRMAAWRARRAS